MALPVRGAGDTQGAGGTGADAGAATVAGGQIDVWIGVPPDGGAQPDGAGRALIAADLAIHAALRQAVIADHRLDLPRGLGPATRQRAAGTGRDAGAAKAARAAGKIHRWKPGGVRLQYAWRAGTQAVAAARAVFDKGGFPQRPWGAQDRTLRAEIRP